MRNFGSRLWALVILLPILTVAGTLLLYHHGPQVWRLYMLYSLELLTHPLIMLFLVLAVSVLAIIMVLRYRHRSELLAFAFLFSAVLHLLTVAFFSLWIVAQPVVEMANEESRHEISTGPPSFSEAMVGEDLRGLLQNIAIEDAKQLEARSRAKPSPDTPLVHERATLELPERAIPLPARQQIDVNQDAADQAVEALLKTLPAPMPSRDTTKLVHIEQIESEPAPEPQELAPQPTLEITQTETPYTPAEETAEAPELALPDVKRSALERESLELVKAMAAELRVEDSLEQRETEQILDQLTMRALSEDAPSSPSPTPEPVERDVSEAASHKERLIPSEARPDTQAPEFEQADVAAGSAVRTSHELPAITRHTRELTEDTTQAPEAFKDSTTLELVDERPQLPTDQEVPGPEPTREPKRTLTADRVAVTSGEQEPLADRPTVDAPAVAHVPLGSAVQETRARPRESSTVTEPLTTHRSDPSLLELPTAIGTTVMPLATSRDVQPSREMPQPARLLQASRTAPAATPTLPTGRPRTEPLPPEARPQPSSSLANAHAMQTAAPATALPSVSAHRVQQTATQQPATITIDVGGRLMFVEASPRATALRPAPLSSRDVAMTYKRAGANAGASASAPLPASSHVTAPRVAESRVTPQSIVASDSIRSLQPSGHAPNVDAALTTLTPEAHAEVAKLGRAVSAIAPATTGTVARAQTLTDVHTFARNRVALSPVSAQDDAALARTERGPARAVASASAVQSKPSALRSTTTLETTDPHRATPGAGDGIHSAPTGLAHAQSGDAPFSDQMKRAKVETPETRSPDSAAPRALDHDMRVSRRQTTTGAIRQGQASNLATPQRTVELPAVNVAARTWSVQAPTLEERTASVDALAATATAPLRPAALAQLSAPVSTVKLPTVTSSQPTATSKHRGESRRLDVSRVAGHRAHTSLPEHGIPPPRTTFIARTPTANEAARSIPLTMPASVRATAPSAAAGESLGAARGSAPRSPKLPVLDLAVQRNRGTTGSVSARARPTPPASGARAFTLSRSRARPLPMATAVAPESGGVLSRPELTDRTHDRATVQLERIRTSRATVDDRVTSDAADRLRTLIAAEVAASRELPSKRAIYQLRSPDKRKLHIEALGGSADTESAVEDALDWLAASQSPNGRWDVDDFEGAEICGGRGNQTDADVGITGFTLLAFLGAGYTHIGGKHQETVKEAIDWIMEGIEPDGDLRRGGQMYDQAMATTALCEALSLTGDSRLKPIAQRAVQFILDAQNPGAAWRYNPQQDNDTSVTGWQILALKSAELAGITVPPQHYRWTEQWLDQVRSGEQGGLYLYRAGHAVTPVMTAEGWFCQIFMGEQSKTRGQQESIEYLMQHLPVWSEAIPGAINFYYWYYATLGLHLSGSDSFGTWNEALTTALLQGRVTEGPAAGTWDPVSHVGVRGGRIYSTAVATLCLEVYYRFLPFYKMK